MGHVGPHRHRDRRHRRHRLLLTQGDPGGRTSRRRSPCPTSSGMTEEAATRHARSRPAWSSCGMTEPSIDVAEGIVIRTDPAAARRSPAGAEVVTSGSPPVPTRSPIPEMKNFTREAQAQGEPRAASASTPPTSTGRPRTAPTSLKDSRHPHRAGGRRQSSTRPATITVFLSTGQVDAPGPHRQARAGGRGRADGARPRADHHPRGVRRPSRRAPSSGRAGRPGRSTQRATIDDRRSPGAGDRDDGRAGRPRRG